MAASRRRSQSSLIDTEQDIVKGMRALRRACPVMRSIHAIAGDPPLRRRPAGFEGLARIIVAQQLSTASAGAIWSRVIAAVDPLTAPGLLAATDDALRAAGLSRPKIRTLRALAAAVAHDGLDVEALSQAGDQQIHEALTAVSGIGPWTADIFIMFCLGRADAFAAGDLALQIALAHAAGLDARPSAAELLAYAERWRPWRGVAARMLWAYYPHMKRVKDGTPV
ncbi:MAG: DNA-3-methyladenine glycosylase [Hyphomicrobiaceae bacterium]